MREGIIGQAPSPVKGLAGALQKRATIVFMNEIMTSKLCLQCHETLSSIEYPACTHDNKLRKKRTCEGVAVKVAVDGSSSQKPKKCFGVLCCNHAECSVKYCDRDVNAIIKMLALLESELRGKESSRTLGAVSSKPRSKQ